jgi:hypothetical protein
VLLSCNVLADLDWRGVHHGDKFVNSSSGEEANGVDRAMIGLEGESGGDVEFSIEENSLVVLIDDDPNFLTFSIFSGNINILLLPIDVYLELD